MKINPKELRIGNIIYDNLSGAYAVILGVESNLVKYSVPLLNKEYDECPPHEDVLIPIPLTEEILLNNCNAKQSGNEWQIKCNGASFIFEGNLHDGYYYTGGEGCKLSNLFYNVHELQNIFKPITGEEVNVEL